MKYVISQPKNILYNFKNINHHAYFQGRSTKHLLVHKDIISNSETEKRADVMRKNNKICDFEKFQCIVKIQTVDSKYDQEKST